MYMQGMYMFTLRARKTHVLPVQYNRTQATGRWPFLSRERVGRPQKQIPKVSNIFALHIVDDMNTGHDSIVIRPACKCLPPVEVALRGVEIVSEEPNQNHLFFQREYGTCDTKKHAWRMLLLFRLDRIFTSRQLVTLYPPHSPLCSRYPSAPSWPSPRRVWGQMVARYWPCSHYFVAEQHYHYHHRRLHADPSPRAPPPRSFSAPPQPGAPLHLLPASPLPQPYQRPLPPTACAGRRAWSLCCCPLRSPPA